jgi:hypothetical protein
MTEYDKLTNQHIIEYESRLKHIDELMERARKRAEAVPGEPEVSKQLAQVMQDREKLASGLEELKSKVGEDWHEKDIERAGPMGIWDAVAQQLEKLVERLER